VGHGAQWDMLILEACKGGVPFMMSLFLAKVIPTQMSCHMAFMEKIPWGR